MKPARDQQRSRVYAAERAWRQTLVNDAHLTLEQIKGAALLILAKSKVDITRLEIGDGRGRRRAGAATSALDPYWAYIAFPKFSRRMSYLCHEIAHVIAGSHVRHGPAFCRTFVRLVREFMGPNEAAALVEAFKAHRVRLHD